MCVGFETGSESQETYSEGSGYGAWKKSNNHREEATWLSVEGNRQTAEALSFTEQGPRTQHGSLWKVSPEC